MVDLAELTLYELREIAAKQPAGMPNTPEKLEIIRREAEASVRVWASIDANKDR